MNNAIFYFFYSFAHQSALLDKIITFFAVWFPYFVVVAAGVFVVMHHEVFKENSTWAVFVEKKKEIFHSFIAGISAWCVAYGLKYLFHTPRPFNLLANVHSVFPESGFAFPSGHATFFMALAVSIFFFHKKAGYWFMVFALVIGIARIAGGVHFPIDILGGYIIGALVAISLKNV